MKRVLIKTLSFATTLLVGVGTSFLFIFLQSNRDDIAPLTITDVAQLMAPPALAVTASESAIRQVDFANFTYPSYFVGEDLVYVYGLDHGKPKLLWAFETGDRADGGYNHFRQQGTPEVLPLRARKAND